MTEALAILSGPNICIPATAQLAVWATRLEHAHVVLTVTAGLECGVFLAHRIRVSAN